MTVKAAPKKKFPEFTHEALIAAGYVRHEWPQYPGWVTYVGPRGEQIGFAGNNATMNNWIENVSNWRVHFPETYKWWMDPKQKDPHSASDGWVIVKGEDPLIKPE